MASLNRKARLHAILIDLFRRRLAVVWMIFLMISGFAVLGVTKIQFDDGLVGIFESNLDRYTEFARYEETFESDSSDIIVLFESADFSDPLSLTAVSDFLLEAQFLDGVSTALSPLSLRAVASGAGDELLVPFPPLPADQMAGRFAADWPASLNLRRMLSRDRQAMLAILPIPDVVEDIGRRKQTLAALEDLAGQITAGSEVEITLSGYPVLRHRMAQGLFSDTIFLNLMGACIGLLVAMLTLRSPRLGLLTIISPGMSLLWILGMLGHLGIHVNVITITLPVLVLVLATSDALHIVIETARQSHQDSTRATLRAVRRIAPACILAALTTAMAFASLTLSRSTMISEMGLAGALATMLSVLCVLATQSLVLTTAGRIWGFERLFRGNRGTPVRALDLHALPRLAAYAPRRVAVLSLLALIGVTMVYLAAEPRYSLFDNLKRGDPILAALHRAEEKVAPVTAMHFPIQNSSPAAIANVHAAIARAAESENVLSLSNLTPQGSGQPGVQGAAPLPEAFRRRLETASEDQAVVTLLFEYTNARETRHLAEALESRIAQDHSLDAFDVAPATGLAVMSSYVSYSVLNELNYSFLVAIVASGLLVAIWLGSIRVALVALVPNILPVAAIGALFVLSGKGMEFSGGLALTVTFGLAVDDTVHVLNRLRISGAIRNLTAKAVARALREVAPALVITSIVLTMGMAGTLFAATTSVVDFGIYSIIVFVLALFADLLVLPALLSVFGQSRSVRRERGLS